MADNVNNMQQKFVQGNSAKKDIPVLVKILAVLYYIGAGHLLILGIIGIFGGASIIVLIPQLSALSGFFFLIAILILGLSVLFFFIGRGLWKSQNWARIIAIIFSFLGIIGVIILLLLGNIKGAVDSSVGVIINAAIGFYLLFNKKVKEAFS